MGREGSRGTPGGYNGAAVNRISLIFIFMVWLSWSPSGPGLEPLPAGWELAGGLGLMGALLVAAGVWSRMMAHRLTGFSIVRDMRSFNRLTRALRTVIPVWFAGLTFFGGWPAVVQRVLADTGVDDLGIELPGFVVGVLPALAAWVLMWVALYPAEKALREQTLLAQLDAELPIHSHPTLPQYLVASFRLQILFMLAPILCIMALRDGLELVTRAYGVTLSDGMQLVLGVGALLPVMILAPWLLVRVLPTVPLPDSPLRAHLETLCRQQGLRVKDILLWRTHSNIGNAAVMGVLPGMRYLLVTDLVLETMPDDQIVAVFAHEIGHVKHHHLWWMGLSGVCFMMVVSGPAETLWKVVSPHLSSLSETTAGLISLAITAPLFYVALGYVSRRFERQADVFAARGVMELLPKAVAVGEGGADEVEGGMARDLRGNAVAGGGARLVSAALYRIAMINNIPVAAFEWLHGSIASRIDYLMALADRPERTAAFDRQMRWVYLTIVMLLVVFGAWTAAEKIW